MRRFIKNNQVIHFKIVRKDIKHAYFRVKDSSVIVTSSLSIAETEIMDLLEENFEKFLELIEREIKNQIPFDVLYLFDEEYELVVDATLSKYIIQEHERVIFIPQKDILETKRQILREQLQSKVPFILNKIKPQLEQEHIPDAIIKIRMLKSKYGSCHIQAREITLNSFLATVPEIYLEYVLYHEFAHLKVPNHSSKFYKLLGRLMSNHRVVQRDLKKLPIVY